MCHILKSFFKHDNVTKSMQVKDYSLKVLRFQQITDTRFLFSKGLDRKMVIMVILQSTLKLYETVRLLMSNIRVPMMKQNTVKPS